MLNRVMFSLGKVDIVFFVAILVIILICVGIYFLIPIINRKQYQQMRENLAKREASFKSNLNVNHAEQQNQEKKPEEQSISE